MPKSVERCVSKFQGKKQVRSPWAVCMSAYNEKHEADKKKQRKK